MAELRTYHAEVDWDGKAWRIRVPEVARTTQARTLREVEPMARDLIARAGVRTVAAARGHEALFGTTQVLPPRNGLAG